MGLEDWARLISKWLEVVGIGTQVCVMCHICLLNLSAKLKFLSPSLIFASVTVRCKALCSVGSLQDFHCKGIKLARKEKITMD